MHEPALANLDAKHPICPRVPHDSDRPAIWAKEIGVGPGQARVAGGLCVIETSEDLVLIDSGVKPSAELLRQELAGLALDWKRVCDLAHPRSRRPRRRGGFPAIPRRARESTRGFGRRGGTQGGEFSGAAAYGFFASDKLYLVNTPSPLAKGAFRRNNREYAGSQGRGTDLSCKARIRDQAGRIP